MKFLIILFATIEILHLIFKTLLRILNIENPTEKYIRF